MKFAKKNNLVREVCDINSEEYQILLRDGVKIDTIPVLHHRRETIVKGFTKTVCERTEGKKISVFVKDGILYGANGNVVIWASLRRYPEKDLALEDATYTCSRNWNPSQDETYIYAKQVVNSSKMARRFHDTSSHQYSKAITYKTVKRINCYGRKWYSIHEPSGEITTHSIGVRLDNTFVECHHLFNSINGLLKIVDIDQLVLFTPKDEENVGKFVGIQFLSHSFHSLGGMVFGQKASESHYLWGKL